MSDGRRVGVAVVGHGETATHMLAAARKIAPTGSLDYVIAVDAGIGETPDLGPTICDAIERVDRGAGVVVLVDLLGASPCQCATREGAGRDCVVLSGLNLAMLLKLATVDRETLAPGEVAQACAESGQRSVQIGQVPRPAQAAGDDT